MSERPPKFRRLRKPLATGVRVVWAAPRYSDAELTARWLRFASICITGAAQGAA